MTLLILFPITANGIIKSDVVANAMVAVDRKNYCPHAPYHDSPQSIGYSATISAPHMVSVVSQNVCDSISIYIFFSKHHID